MVQLLASSAHVAYLGRTQACALSYYTGGRQAGQQEATHLQGTSELALRLRRHAQAVGDRGQQARLHLQQLWKALCSVWRKALHSSRVQPPRVKGGSGHVQHSRRRGSLGGGRNATAVSSTTVSCRCTCSHI